MEFSSYQKRIFKEIKESDKNIVIEAVAGSGKTTTIEQIVKLVPKDKDKIFLAFNNTIVNELKDRISVRNTTISTMHSFCWRNLIRHKRGGLKLNESKGFFVVKDLLKKHKIPSKRHKFYLYVIPKIIGVMRLNLMFEEEGLMDLGEHYGYDMDENICNIALEALEIMNKDQKSFDFTDMIYQCYAQDVRLPKFDYIFVDEAQDLSPLQQFIISKIKKRNGRMIAVGDPGQAIYGFAGADVDSFNNLKNIFPNTITLPLSVNYRCGKRIIQKAQKINQNILPFDGSPKGIVRNSPGEDVEIGDWVLCRNLKPLIFMNLFLIDKGVNSYIKGGELGKSLENFVNKFSPTSVHDLLDKIDKEVINQIDKLFKKGIKNPNKVEKIFNLRQRQDIIGVLAKDVGSVNKLILKIQKIFKEQKNSVTLSTIHKAKGLENDRIFFLCPELIPNKFATQPWQLQQENNLEYVAITRAKKELHYINDYNEIEKTVKELL